MTQLFQDLIAWVGANPSWAYLVIFIGALTESLAVVGLIVPGVVMMVGAGTLIATGALAFWPVFLWAVAGAVAGDSLSYWIGRRFKDDIRGVWPFSRHPESLDYGIAFFDRYGGWGVALARFVGAGRAIVPLVAGMLHMPPGRFLVANVLSAFAWAPAYLLPGMLLGASLELAAEAAARLVVLILLLAAILWLTLWLVRELFLVLSPRASLWVQALLHWTDLHPRFREVARALADPSHPAARTLTALAGILMLATLVFALVTGLAVAGPADLAINRMVLELWLSLRAPPADHPMALLGRLGDRGVLLLVTGVIYAFLLARRQRQAASYWLAAAAFAFLVDPLLGLALPVPRPDIGLAIAGGSFPSGHVLRATVLFGFLAVLLAGAAGPAWRWLPYAWAGVLVVGVATARLYFGVHWLTDVLGSITLGLIWVAVLGLSFRRRARRPPYWPGLAGLVLATLALGVGITAVLDHHREVERYALRVTEQRVTAADWQGGALPLAHQREDLLQRNLQPLDLQYAGSLADFSAALGARGWKAADPLGWHNLLLLASPSSPLKALPVIPQVHAGSQEALALVKDLAGGERLVVRLWPTVYRIDPQGVPLWLGQVTAQRKAVIFGLLGLAVTANDHAAARGVLLADLEESPGLATDAGVGAIRIRQAAPLIDAPVAPPQPR